MFSYNRFWHFWHTLNNRSYLRLFKALGLTELSLGGLGIFVMTLLFPQVVLPILAVIAVVSAPIIIVAAAVAIFTKLSNVLYHKQNRTLQELKVDEQNKPKFEKRKEYIEQVDLYLNRRVVCPKELLEGKLLNLPKIKEESEIQNAFAVDDDSELRLERKLDLVINRNPMYLANCRELSTPLFIKRTAGQDGLSELAAREMAELMGFQNLIPSNSVVEDQVMDGSILGSDLFSSRKKIRELVETRAQETEHDEKPIHNTLGVQRKVEQFLFNFKTGVYRNRVKRNPELKLLHVQEGVQNAQDGFKLVTDFFEKKFEEVYQVLCNIDLQSFQDNFLLQIVLGSQDCNPGNTLFASTESPSGKKQQRLYSIDHERIMPEDNYNMTKSIPVGNGSNVASIVEKEVKNVFPIRLWLAGLPQAERPFSSEIIEKVLNSLNPDRILAYHRQKKLFSSAAVGAQLERIQLIRTLFEAEIKKEKPTLTPKALFLKLVNNHPSYAFLKDKGLSDFSTFMLLGQIPEDADWSIIRHPMQTLGMWKSYVEAIDNQSQGSDKLFSDKHFATSAAAKFTFYCIVQNQQNAEKICKDSFDVFESVSKQLQ